MRIRPLSMTLLAAALMPAFCSIGWAQSSSASEGQALIDQGIAAARQQDYTTAVDRFEDAGNLIGYTQEVLFDLGLASSKVPGHELRAIAAFEAYLRYAGDAENARAVRAQTDALEAAFEAKLRAILDQLDTLWLRHKDVSSESLVGPGSSGAELAQARSNVLRWIAWDLARSRFLLGDQDGAKKMLRAGGGDDWPEVVRQDAHDDEKPAFGYIDTEDYLVTAMIAAGLFEEAVGLLPRIRDPDSVSFAFEQGNASRSHVLIEKGTYESWLASACFAQERGDLTTMNEAITRAAAAADPDDLAGLVGVIDSLAAEVLVDQHDQAGSAAISNRAREIAASITDDAQRRQAEAFIAGSSASGRCSRSRWPTAWRWYYQRLTAVQGMMLNSAYDDTKLPEYVASYALDGANFGESEAGLASVAAGTANLLEAYRKTRGPRIR